MPVQMEFEFGENGHEEGPGICEIPEVYLEEVVEEPQEGEELRPIARGDGEGELADLYCSVRVTTDPKGWREVTPAGFPWTDERSVAEAMLDERSFVGHARISRSDCDHRSGRSAGAVWVTRAVGPEELLDDGMAEAVRIWKAGD